MQRIAACRTIELPGDRSSGRILRCRGHKDRDTEVQRLIDEDDAPPRFRSIQRPDAAHFTTPGPRRPRAHPPRGQAPCLLLDRLVLGNSSGTKLAIFVLPLLALETDR